MENEVPKKRLEVGQTYFSISRIIEIITDGSYPYKLDEKYKNAKEIFVVKEGTREATVKTIQYPNNDGIGVFEIVSVEEAA